MVTVAVDRNHARCYYAEQLVDFSETPSELFVSKDFQGLQKLFNAMIDGKGAVSVMLSFVVWMQCTPADDNFKQTLARSLRSSSARMGHLGTSQTVRCSAST